MSSSYRFFPVPAGQGCRGLLQCVARVVASLRLSLIVVSVRAILHDWSSERCRTILKVVRDAAGPSSKLIIFDMMMPYACEYAGPLADVISADKPPAPLLANWGLGMGGFVTWIDVQVSS